MELNPLMAKLGTESAFTVLNRAAFLAAQGKGIINLGIGQPDFPTPPHIVEAAVKALRDGHHGYTAAKGLPQLREAVAADFEARNGVSLDPERLMIMPGGKPTIAFAMLMLGGAGHEILYPDPGFPIYGSMAAFSGAQAVPYALTAGKSFGLDAEAVLEKMRPATRLLVLNSPGNPTGGVTSAQELEKLANGLQAWPDVWVLSDEIYSRLYFDGLTHLSPMTFETLRARTIVLDGWSKTYAMTGWRLGWSYWPQELIDLAERLAINVHSCVSATTQFAGLAALEGDQSPVLAMCTAFEARRNAALARIAQIDRLSTVQPKGAFYALVKVDGLTCEDVQNRLLEEAGVATIAGTSFGAAGVGHIRMSFANSQANVLEALDRTESWLGSVA